jgi:hypothetical protein
MFQLQTTRVIRVANFLTIRGNSLEPAMTGTTDDGRTVASKGKKDFNH